ncbi:MAG: hypothetical protein H0V66_15420 [Bdellovibrionales bacterium]|nr:hypothetical protein [Bdellovibrionales bacterium]
MKFLIIILFLTTTVWGQDDCDSKDQSACQKLIHSAIFFEDHETIKKVLKKYGIQKFFQSDSIRGPYGNIQLAGFYQHTKFFKILAAHPSFPADIPDKNEFLRMTFVENFKEKDPELLTILFANADQSKNLEWWGNGNWPYPMFDKFKKNLLERKDKEKYQALLTKFEEIDAFKKDICQVDSIEKLNAMKLKNPGIETFFKNPNYDLLACAIKSGNKDFALHLIDQKFFNPKNLPKFVTELTLSPVTKSNIAMVALLEKKMMELKIPHPDKELTQTLWIFDHLSEEVECLQQTDNELLSNVKSFTDLAPKIVFSALLKEIAKLKKETNELQKNKIAENIIDLINQSGLPKNYQDESGKTIMHHLAEFIDFNQVEKFEKGLNDYTNYMNYKIQDNDGNTPLHVSLIHKNMSGSLALADDVNYWKSGFGYGIRKDVDLKNKQGKTQLDVVKDLDVSKKDRDTLKKIKIWLKEHQKLSHRLIEEDDD